jgi:hypothetical protein
MDLLGVILTGAVAGAFGLCGALLALRIVGSQLKREVQSQIHMVPDLIIAEINANPEKYAVLVDQVRSRLEREAIGYVTKVLKAIHDHPEQFAPIVNGLITDLGKMFPQMKGQVMQNIGAGTIESVLPFIPKNLRPLAALAQAFLGSRGENAKQTASASPFG